MLAAETTLFDWVYEAEGLFFWPQVILAFITLTHLLVCIDRYWLMPWFQSWGLPGRLHKAIRRRDSDEAWVAVQSGGSNLARIARQGFHAAEHGADRQQLEEELGQACDAVDLGDERRLTFLNMLAQVNMLVGLLGTVWGLVQSFLVISQSNVAPPPRELAAGVSQALVTTIWGLFLAIPALFFFVLLRGSASQINQVLAQTLSRMVPLFEQHRETQAYSSTTTED